MAYTNKKVSESAGLHREIVTSLPATGDENTIYMVLDQTASSPDIYDEWLWTNGAYEHLGSTRVDLSDYYNKTQVDTALSGKANTSDIPTALSQLTDDTTHRVVTDTEKTAWNGKASATDVDNAINTALDNSKIATFTQTFANEYVNTTYGAVYGSSVKHIDISRLGLQSPPKAVYLSAKDTANYGIMIEFFWFTSTDIAFRFVSPNKLIEKTYVIVATVIY